MEAYKYYCFNSSTIKSGYHRLVLWRPMSRSGTRSPTICRWRMLWGKLKRQNKRVFDFSTTGPGPLVAYDPYTYSQNFDQGSMSDDPDNISRSFSARFSLPSTSN